MRSLVKWGSVVLLAALAVLTVWSSTGRPTGKIGPNSGNVGQNVRLTQPPPGVGINSNNVGTTNWRPVGTVEEVRRVAEGVPGVKRAWPVQSGNDILVGVEMDMTAGDNSTAVEKQVAQRIDGQIPSVDNVRVTSRPAQVGRLRTIFQSVGLGRNTGDFSRDIANIWGNTSSTTSGDRK